MKTFREWLLMESKTIYSKIYVGKLSSKEKEVLIDKLTNTTDIISCEFLGNDDLKCVFKTNISKEDANDFLVKILRTVNPRADIIVKGL